MASRVFRTDLKIIILFQIEGQFEGRRRGTSATSSFARGDRVDVVRHKDNLHVEGAFEGRPKTEAVLKGERAIIKKHEDNLKMEGTFEAKKTEVAVSKGERAVVKKHEDNLKLVKYAKVSQRGHSSMTSRNVWQFFEPLPKLSRCLLLSL